MSKITDSIIGHAIGDAMGMPTEFCIREHLLSNPVTDMIGSKKVGQPAGTWTDDTSMEIATIESIISNKGFNYSDIMTRWCDWLNKGDYTPNGEAFEVGRTCLRDCKNFIDGIEPTKFGLSDYELLNLVNDVSSLTHGHNISKLVCYMYVKFVVRLFNGMSKEECYKYLSNDDYGMYDDYSISKYDRLIKDDITKLKIDDIKSSGYVVDTWECVLWILLKSKSFKETIIATTNIGQDTDTIGAIAGSMAGIIYGMDETPKQWLDTLIKKDYLINLANKLEKIKGDK